MVPGLALDLILLCKAAILQGLPHPTCFIDASSNYHQLFIIGSSEMEMQMEMQMETEMLLSDPSSPECTTKQLSLKPHHHELHGEFLKTNKKKFIFFCYKGLSITNSMSNRYQETMPHFF